MLHERRAGDATQARYDIDDAVRETGLFDEFRKAKTRQRSLLCGLEDDGISGREGRRNFPGRVKDGAIPWNDRADDAEWFATRIAERSGVRGVGLAEHFGRPAGVVPEDVDHRPRREKRRSVQHPHLEC